VQNEDIQIKSVNYSNRNIYMYELNENFCEKYGRCTNMETLSGTFNNNTIPLHMKTYTAVPHCYDDKTPSPPPTEEPPIPNGTRDTTTSPLPSPGLTDPLTSSSGPAETTVDGMVTEGETMETDVGATEEQPTEGPSQVEQKFQCLICFEDFSYTDAINNTVLKHKRCGSILCDACLQVSS